jgi:hypothetical protein
VDSPVSPEERRQAELRHEAQEKIRQQVALRNQILERHGAALERTSRAVLENEDRGIQTAAAGFMAQEFSEKKIRDPSQLDKTSLMNAAERAVGKAYEAEAQQRKQEAEQAAQLKEAEARKAALKAEPIPGAVQRFNEVIAARKAAQNDPAQTKDRSIYGDVRPYSALPSNTQLKSESDRGNQVRRETSDAKQEISEGKAERLARAFNRVSSDKAFDPSHDPENAMNFSNTRGRGGR